MWNANSIGQVWTQVTVSISYVDDHYATGASYIRGSLNKFPDFFRMGTFIDSTHMKL